MAGFRDRIKELRRVRAGDLLANPKNWRTHPEAQQNVLRALLADIGFADALLARETKKGLQLIDGHLRQSLDPEQIVPVLVLDVTAAEANKLLLTLDPLAGMAEANAAALESLLAEIQTDNADLQAMLDGLAATIVEVDIPEPPDSVQQNAAEIEEIKNQRRRANANVATERDTEIYLTVVFRSRAERETLLRTLGLPQDERYLLASAVNIKPRSKVTPVKLSGGRDATAADTSTSGATG